MQGVFSSPSGSSVKALGLTFMAAALGGCDLLLDGSKKTTRFEPVPIAGHRRVLEAQIQPHLRLRSLHLRDRMFYRSAKPPIPDRILGKAATFPASIRE